MIETKTEPAVSVAAKAAPLLPISVIVPARNEAHNLRRCLESLHAVGEVFVVDSQSTDETVAIAESLGARVVQFHYAGGCRWAMTGSCWWMRMKR
jgi:glycosyltransferase involved in cell wall biosynthesis